MSYNNTVPSQIQSRRMIIARHEGCNQPVSVASPLWEPLTYPLFFPLGTLGWGLTNATPADLPPSNDCHAVTTQLWFGRLTGVSALCTYFHTMLPLEHGIL